MKCHDCARSIRQHELKHDPPKMEYRFDLDTTSGRVTIFQCPICKTIDYKFADF